jgi:hypothetical protein
VKKVPLLPQSQRARRLAPRETVGEEPLTPDAVAREYGVPVEAVVEASDDCVRNQPLLDAERAREAARIKAAGRDRWLYAPRASRPPV